MLILGVHDGHNASAVLMEDGVVRYCIQEERLTGVKNQVGCPEKSIRWMLKEAGIKVGDIDTVAMASDHTFTVGNIIESYKKVMPPFRSHIRRLLRFTPVYTVYRTQQKSARIKRMVKLGFPEKKLRFIDHHLSHAAAAYYGSPWRKDMLVLSLDGSGDGLCSTVSTVENGGMKRIAETPDEHSIGHIYSMVTFLMGFVPLDHEYKLMGMAPHASPKNAELVAAVFRRYVGIDPKNPMAFRRRIMEGTSLIYPRLRRELELFRFDAICAGLQLFTEELMTAWVANCVKETGLHRLALGGGVFMNVKANLSLMQMDEVKDLFIFPSCGDESSSLGAAYVITAEKMDPAKIPPIGPIYWGGSFGEEGIERELRKHEGKLKWERCGDISVVTAEMLKEKKVVARFAGRMEFGARALGNRSILADPIDYGCLRTLNRMVKSRDFWMPFAPVMMHERQHDYIVNPKNVEAPYMILAFPSTDRWVDYPAAAHQADLSARPQVIRKEWNPPYHATLEKFERLTGRAVLLNTSFNLHGFPIVHTPAQALDVMLNSGLRHLVMEDFMVTKVGGSE